MSSPTMIVRYRVGYHTQILLKVFCGRSSDSIESRKSNLTILLIFLKLLRCKPEKILKAAADVSHLLRIRQDPKQSPLYLFRTEGRSFSTDPFLILAYLLVGYQY